MCPEGKILKRQGTRKGSGKTLELSTRETEKGAVGALTPRGGEAAKVVCKLRGPWECESGWLSHLPECGAGGSRRSGGAS